MVFIGKALVEIQGAAVGSKSGIADKFFGSLDGGEAVVLEYVFFDDDAVDVVGAAVQAEFPEGKPHAEQRDFDMRDVIEVQAA